LLGAIDQSGSGQRDHGRGMAHRAAGMRPAALADAVGVAEDHIDGIDRDAEQIGCDLREAGFMALPAGLHAGDKFDTPLHRDRDFGALQRRAGR
jgi:hypothetical protein